MAGPGRQAALEGWRKRVGVEPTAPAAGGEPLVLKTKAATGPQTLPKAIVRNFAVPRSTRTGHGAGASAPGTASLAGL